MPLFRRGQLAQQAKYHFEEERTHPLRELLFRPWAVASFDRGSDADRRLLAELLHKHDALAGHGFDGKTTRSRAESLLRARCPDLSPREAQVCALIACGYSASRVALELNISEETVITFRKRTYRKLHISSRGELFAHCTY